ncbi:Thymocyte nuclear protein 1 [Mytilus edulis]|uniref:Thymocyte nuclear protein 1 n=1 Tax=Mytilus edulis TaxID=6550 RepID=A0A8S3TUL6_MYTED|nr:Thymocyte nuclear protein 1 [Mytilus edulis]
MDSRGYDTVFLTHIVKEYYNVMIHCWYDWQQSPDHMHSHHHCPADVRAGYVPMVNGKHFDRGINISANAHYLLGFNDPDRRDQANLSASQAAVMWKELEANAVGKILVSPAVSSLDWLQQFMQQCHNCRVDHVAVHVFNCNAHEIMRILKQAWDRFEKPIWLTEFACPHTTSANDQLRLMREILPLLESAPYVYRYAWFASRWMKHLDGGNTVDISATLIKENTFGIEDLKKCKNQTDCWDGVRNYQTRNFKGGQMKIGHQVFFYHSNCKEPGIAGICKVVKESCVDYTQSASKDPHYDQSAKKDAPKWYMVDVKFERMLKKFIPLIKT